MVVKTAREKEDLMRTLFKIDDKQGVVVPFRLNSVTRYFAENKGFRNYIIKARQLWISSYILADMFLESITVRNTPCAVVSHETRATQRLLDRVHFYHDSMPEPRPELGSESRSELTFPGLHSSIYIGTAGSRAFGRGDTLRKAHLSEFAFYEDGERILAGVEDAVPLGAELTLETTPNGEEDISYDLWVRSREGRTGYKTFFFPWWMGFEYTIPRGSPLALEEDRGELNYGAEEAELVNKHHLTEGQIRWRRRKIADKGGLFFRDYPEDEVTCFQQSGAPVFDAELILQLARGCYEGEKDKQGFSVWIPPAEGGVYLIGVDSAPGDSERGSLSAAVVLDCMYRVCATFQGRIELIPFVKKLKAEGKAYNSAMLVVERNNPGYTVLSHLVDYPNVYLQRDFTTGKITAKPGWWTSGATKDFMLAAFKELLPRFKTWDINLVRQARGYRYVRYIPTAQSSSDLMMAAMIAVAVRKMTGTSQGYRGHIPGWSW